MRLFRGPLAAALGIAALALSQGRTSIAVLGPYAAWPAGLAALPLLAAWAELSLGRRRVEEPTEPPLQRRLDAYGWLALCGLDLLFPWFAARLVPFLPALGLLLLAADRAWIASACRGRLRQGSRIEGWPARRLWLAGALLGLVVPGLQLSGLVDRHKSFTGDEPAYLLVSLSLLEDGDLVLNNQYRGRQYRRFGTERYPVFAHPGLDGRLYPHHNAGLPALLVPAVAAGLGDEARLALCVRGFLACLAALAAGEIALLGLALGGGVRAGLWSAAFAALAVPFGFYGTQVYPEMPAALLAAMAYRRILGFGAGGGLRAAAWAGLAAGLLVWLHYKFLPLAALLGLLGLLRPQRLPQRLLFAVLLAAPVGLFLLFVHATYGTWSPNALQLGARAAGEAAPVVLGAMGERLRHTPLNFLGYFLDQRIGLLIYAPAYLLAVPGVAVLGGTSRKRAAELLALGLTPLALYAWIYWSMGGYGPPNRPAVPGVPFLAVLAGIGAASARGWAARRLRDALLFPGLMASAALLLHHDALYHPMSVRSEGARNMLLTYHGPAGFDLTRLFPAYLGQSLNLWPNALFPLGTAALGALLLWVWRRPETRLPPLHAEIRLGRLALGTVALGLVLVRLGAVARTPVEVERGGTAEALILGGEGWVEPGPAVWVRGGGAVRLLVPDASEGPLQIRIEALAGNRVAIRSGGRIEVLELLEGGVTELELDRPWRLSRGGRGYVLLEAACASGVQEPRGPRWLGVRLSFTRP
jgi:hypothetical protein